MNDNIKIPSSLLDQVIYILININISDYCDDFQTEYYDLLRALNKKKASIALREIYADIIHAKDEDSRNCARVRYLQHKRILKEGF